MKSIIPSSEQAWLDLRSRNINSTEVAALFGVSPYMSLYQLWHEKRGDLKSDFKPTERTKWGKKLEAVIAERVAEEFSVNIEPMPEYIWDDDARLGSSFDYRIKGYPTGGGTEEIREAFIRYNTPGILEIKNVDRLQWRKAWLDDESQEAPEHIELQLQHQLMVSGCKWGVIAAFIGGNDLRTYVREADPALHAIIRRKIAEFWSMPEPAPEYPADADVVRALHQSISGDAIEDMRASNELADACARYKAAAVVAKQADADKSTASAQILEIVGERKGALATGFKVTTWHVDEAEVSYLRKGYRGMKVTEVG